MRIKKLNRTEPPHLRFIYDTRCDRSTTSTGAGDWPSSKWRCARFALFNIDGNNFCKQHAGEYTLLKAIQENTDNDTP